MQRLHLEIGRTSYMVVRKNPDGSLHALSGAYLDRKSADKRLKEELRYATARNSTDGSSLPYLVEVSLNIKEI